MSKLGKGFYQISHHRLHSSLKAFVKILLGLKSFLEAKYSILKILYVYLRLIGF